MSSQSGPAAVLERLRSTLRQCAELEERLAALNSSGGNINTSGGNSNSNATEASIEAKNQKLRTKLCEHYCDVLLTDPPFALRRDVPHRLWKGCFYQRISELRARATRERGRMRKCIKRSDRDGAARHRRAVQDVEASLAKFLGEATALYRFLISQYEAKLLRAVQEGGDDDDNNNDGDSNAGNNGNAPVILSNSKSSRGLFDPNNDDVYAIARKERQDRQNNKKKNKKKNKKRKGGQSGMNTTSSSDDNSSDDDEEDDDNDEDKTNANASANSVPSAALVPILYRLFLFLGDLQRYALEHDDATSSYARASRLSPGQGNPYNQLAVVAQVSDQQGQKQQAQAQAQAQAHPLTAVALYWYCRSLLADEAFDTSESNMERLFVMNQRWVSEHIAAGTDGGIADAIAQQQRGGGGNLGLNNPADDASEVTEAASMSAARGGSSSQRSGGSSSNRNRKAQLEANRAAKSAMSRKYLAQFVDVQYDLRKLTKALEESAALTPVVSNSRKEDQQFDPSALLQRMATLDESLSSLLTIAAFSDALLCKLVCIGAYSYFKATAAAAAPTTDGRTNPAELLSATILLSFGATLGRQLDWNLTRLKKKKRKDGGNDSNNRQQQQQLSIRLLSPFVVLCDIISQFYGGSDQNDGESMVLPLGIRQGKYSSKGCGEGIAAAFSKAQFDFWTQAAAVANTVRSMEAFTMLVNTTNDASGTDDETLRAFPLPKEYGDFRGFAPFTGVFALYEARDASRGSGKDAYLSAEKAVAVLDLRASQSQSQSQGSASGQQPKEGNNSSAEAHARVLHFLLFLKRHSIDPGRGTPKMEEGQFLFEERGKLTSILDSSTLNDIAEEGDDDNMVHLGSDNEDNGMVDTAVGTGVADAEASETTCASPSLAGGGGEGDGGANLLEYKKGADSGPALLVPTMFGVGDAGGAAASTSNTAMTSAINAAAAASNAQSASQPRALGATSIVNPGSSVASQPSLMSGIPYPQQQSHSRQGMDGVVLEGVIQHQQHHTNSGPPPPGFATGVGDSVPPPGMIQQSLFPPTTSGGSGSLPSVTLSLQGGPSGLATANPFVPMPLDNQITNAMSSDNLLFPPPQSSLLGGVGGSAGNNGGGLISSLPRPASGIFASYDDILNESSEHDSGKNATDETWGGWMQQTNNPFAANIQ